MTNVSQSFVVFFTIIVHTTLKNKHNFMSYRYRPTYTDGALVDDNNCVKI